MLIFNLKGVSIEELRFVLISMIRVQANQSNPIDLDVTWTNTHLPFMRANLQMIILQDTEPN